MFKGNPRFIFLPLCSVMLFQMFCNRRFENRKTDVHSSLKCNPGIGGAGPTEFIVKSDLEIELK
jgi:hypothetical protein